MIPKQYQYLEKEPGPKMLLEGLKLYGTLESVGDKDNPEILAWAKELGLKDYLHDSIAWCGLFVAIIAKRAGKEVVDAPLWAANWLKWGEEAKEPMLGDVLVFKRPGGNHVALYVGEDKMYYHCLGGNQSDSVSITRILKTRCRGARRLYKEQPSNIRKIFVDPQGNISSNEA